MVNVTQADRAGAGTTRDPLTCSICGASVRGRLDSARLRMWQKPAHEIVRVEVVCVGRCERASLAVGHARDELEAWDDTLEYFTGCWSLLQLAAAATAYTLAIPAARELVVVLEQLRTMPDGDGPLWFPDGKGPLWPRP